MTTENMLAEPKVAKDVAELEFVRMCAAFRVNPGKRDTDLEQAIFLGIKEPIIEAMMAGNLVVLESGLPEIAPVTVDAEGKRLPKMRFSKPKGATFMAMDDAPGKQFTRWALAAQSMIGCAPGTIAKLDGDDFDLVVSLTRLFLRQG